MENAMKLEELIFGLEIEMTGLSRKEAISLLHEALSEHLEIKNIINNKITTIDDRIWKIVRDSSITPMINISKITTNNYLTINDFVLAEDLIKTAYIEFVTPKCTLKDWPIIRGILKKFRDNGAKVNDSCGIHIHVDATHYDGAYIHKLCYVVMSYEPLIYKILDVNASRKNKYCIPMSSFFKRYIRNTARERMGEVTLSELKPIWNSPFMENPRYHGLNLDNVINPDLKCTVEFRYFNSTLHAGKIRSYLYLVFALLNKAQTINKIPDVIFRSYRKPNLTQLEKWLFFMGLTEDSNVCTHLLNGYVISGYFQ